MKKDSIKIGEYPDGTEIFIHQYTLTGSRPGPTIYIQANVHGAELQGNQVIHLLYEYFSNNEFNGVIKFVPTANPYSIREKSGTYTQGRFNTQTGINWNRSYQDLTLFTEENSGFSINDFAKSVKSYQSKQIQNEYKVAIKKALINYRDQLKAQYALKIDKALHLELQILSSDADIVLDLHTGPVATDYIYAGKYQKEDVFNLGFPFNLIIPNEFAGAMDEANFVPWVELKKELSKFNVEFEIPIQAYTVELGSEEVISLERAKLQTSRLLNFLSKYSILSSESLNNYGDVKQFYSELENYKTITSPHGGLFEYLKGPGEFFKQGDVLGRYLFPHEFNKAVELKAHMEGVVINHNPSSSVYSGVTLFQILTDLKTK